MKRKIFTIGLLLLGSVLTHAQIVEDSLFVDGHYRSFVFKKPSNDRKHGSLVFAIHGSGGTARGFMRQTEKIDSRMEQDNFLIVFPQGYKNYWNECRKASTAEANRIDINEEGFFLAMIGYFEERYRIDRKKVFVSGLSGGGQMAYKMGMRLPDVFRAIAAGVANLPTPDNMDCHALGKPLPVLIVNSTADKVNPHEGGEMKAGLPLGNVMSTDESFRYWAELAGYSGVPRKELLPDPVPENTITMESFTFSEKNKPEVKLINVINGEHSLPADINFYEEAWRFFKRQIK